MAVHRVLVVGIGGREHAIAWKLAQSEAVSVVFVGGVVTPDREGKVQSVSGPVGSAAPDSGLLVAWCRDMGVTLVVVGPEGPLAAGMVDVLHAAGIACFGPTQAAATLETSKIFSKNFMLRQNIPTARFQVFDNADAACQYIAESPFPAHVIKVDGLAAGKGVLVAASTAEAQAAARDFLTSGKFGSAGSSIVVEEKLEGPEVSLLAFCDGRIAVPMVPAQDHKTLLDDGRGPNTGGMGAYAPYPGLSVSEVEQIRQTILQPTVDGMRAEGCPYHGVLYAGIMLTPAGPRVLEYNCRFGDPETQAILPLMTSDILPTLLACIPGHAAGLTEAMPLFATDKSCVAVVLVSRGYPEAYEQGFSIGGLTGDTYQLKSGLAADSIILFHAGVKLDGKQLVTAGGRVLAAVCVKSTLQQAATGAYAAIKQIDFEGCQFRHDIGASAIKLLRNKITYEDAGVNIEEGDRLVEEIKPLAKSTSRVGCAVELGGFGGLFDLAACGYRDPLLISGTDGVGTKLKIAHAMDFHATIGVDLVAMCVNDILAHGAEPLFFLDYLATGHLSVDQLRSVVAGVVDGCKAAGCALVGGETAEMPGMYEAGAYDVAGFAVGAVERSALLPRTSEIRPGDVVIGLGSSGVHSNGYSLVRKLVAAAGLDYRQAAPYDSAAASLGRSLLTPTRIYVKPILALHRKGLVKALAHITGGGLLENIPRILPAGLAVKLDASTWSMPPVFQWLCAQGNLSDTEMARYFNCGLGMVLLVDPVHVQDALMVLQREHGEAAWAVGSVVEMDKGASAQVTIAHLEEALHSKSFGVPMPAQTRRRVAVLISGSGTNLQSLIDISLAQKDYPAEIVLIISNRPGVQGLERAARAGIDHVVVDHKQFPSREVFEDAVQQRLQAANVDLVCLAGFMRILTKKFVSKWIGRLLNIHPSLLPSFRGIHAHEQALAAGVRLSGCTVHFVNHEVDDGAIIAQEAVSVLPKDTVEMLQERVKGAEHVLYPRALALVASGTVTLGPNNQAIFQ